MMYTFILQLILIPSKKANNWLSLQPLNFFLSNILIYVIFKKDIVCNVIVLKSSKEKI